MRDTRFTDLVLFIEQEYERASEDRQIHDANAVLEGATVDPWEHGYDDGKCAALAGLCAHARALHHAYHDRLEALEADEPLDDDDPTSALIRMGR